MTKTKESKGWEGFFRQWKNIPDKDIIEFLWGNCADMGSSDGMLMSVKRVGMFTEGLLYWHNQELEKARAEAIDSALEACRSQYDKLQETKYYKELSYIEKQVYLSGVEDLSQAIELLKTPPQEEDKEKYGK